MSSREKVLITGIAGGQGRLLARRLLDSHEVVGADVQAWKGAPQGVRSVQVDLRKRKFEDVVRTERPGAIVHMGYVRHFRGSEEKRHDVNVRGTKQLLDHCVKYGVEKLVVMSSGYVYGAFPENPYFLEEDAPLSASRSYPEIRDLVEVDTLSSTFMWKYPEVRTSVLRPVNVLGRTVHSMARTYLSQSRVPTVMGFNPMMQFIHEADLSEAIVLALEHGLRGVYNIVGPGEVPVHTAIRETGGKVLPIPEPLARGFFDWSFRWGFASYPPGMLDFLKYPASLSGDHFREATNFKCLYGLPEIFESIRP